MQTRYCPNCGKPLAFLPSRNRYFCNYCRLPFDAEGPVSDDGAPRTPLQGPAKAKDGPPPENAIPEDIAASLPAQPPREATLYAPVSDLKPVVRRSSLLKGTVEAMAEDEARRAVQTGDYIILSKMGRCALLAARKSFGEVHITPRVLDSPGLPWRFQISSDAASVEVGLFKAQAARPPARMPQPIRPAADEFYAASLTLNGPPSGLSGFISVLLGLLEEPPWASRYWAAMAQSLNLPSSQLLLNWKQYLDYATARSAATEVAAARKAVEEAQKAGFPASETLPALRNAVAALSHGDYDEARARSLDARQQLDGFLRQKQKLSEMKESISAAVAQIKLLDPGSEQAPGLEREMTDQLSDASQPVDAAIQRASQVLGKAAFALFSMYVERGHSYLSKLQDEAPDLSRELRAKLQGELERGRRLLESGDVQGGTEVLERAGAAIREQADGHFSELAVQTLEQARISLETLRASQTSGADTGGALEEGLEEAQRLLDAGRSAESGRMAQKLLKEIEDRLEASSPQISISITGPPLTAGGWNRVVMKLANTGTADARDLSLTIKGPVELMALDEIGLIKAGAVYNDDIGVRCASPGTVPVKLVVECTRAPDEKQYRFETELWLEFRQGLDISGAKSITIDRSVHIVDSVLNRSMVGGEDELEGVPQQSPDGEPDGKGSKAIQDSVINRSGRSEMAKPEDAEAKCPNCGRMISTEWKRCPYCS